MGLPPTPSVPIAPHVRTIYRPDFDGHWQRAFSSGAPIPAHPSGDDVFGFQHYARLVDGIGSPPLLPHGGPRDSTPSLLSAVYANLACSTVQPTCCPVSRLMDPA